MLKYQLKVISVTRALILPISAATLVVKCIAEVALKERFKNLTEPDEVIPSPYRYMVVAAFVLRIIMNLFMAVYAFSAISYSIKQKKLKQERTTQLKGLSC